MTSGKPGRSPGAPSAVRGVPASPATSNGTRPCRRDSTLACRLGARDMADTESHDARTETGSGPKPLRSEDPRCGQLCQRGAWAFLVRGRAQHARCVQEEWGAEAAACGSVQHCQVLNRYRKRPAGRPCPLHGPSRVTQQSAALVCAASLPEAPRLALGFSLSRAPSPRDCSGTAQRPSDVPAPCYCTK